MQSPCIGRCILYKNTCEGCGRTLDEIARWNSMTDKKRDEVMSRLDKDDNKRKL